MKTLSPNEKEFYNWLVDNGETTIDMICKKYNCKPKSASMKITRLNKKGIMVSSRRNGSNGNKVYTVNISCIEDTARYKKYDKDNRGKAIYDSLVGLNEVITDMALPDTPTYEFDETIGIIGIGDIHCGNTHADLVEAKRLFHDVIPKVDNLYVYLLGDLFDNSNTINSPSGTRSTLSAEEEAELLEWLLKPSKDRIIGMCDGNHEHRTLKASGVRLGKLLGNDNIPYSTYGMTVNIKVGNYDTELYFRHKMDGHSQYNPLHPNVRSILFREAGSADVIWRAHTHESAIGVYKVEGKYRVLMVSGNMVVYDEYADSLGMSPRISDYPILILTKDGRRIPVRGTKTGIDILKNLQV